MTPLNRTKAIRNPIRQALLDSLTEEQVTYLKSKKSIPASVWRKELIAKSISLKAYNSKAYSLGTSEADLLTSVRNFASRQ
jgi:hypothetical protein